MDKYIINGGKKICGDITAESSKNAVLPMLAACVLTDEEVIIQNCPKISDVMNMLKILNYLGASTYFSDNNLVVNASGINKFDVPTELSKELRASVLLLGALLSRNKKVKLAYPGGCDIGMRPIDIHIDALRHLGAVVGESEGEILCDGYCLAGNDVYLDFPSVGATENIILTSVLLKGITKIHNPAKEPEIVDLAMLLNKMGAKVSGAGSNTIVIEGVKRLSGATHKPIPDRIEVGTYLIAAAITGGEIEIKNVKPENISSLIVKLCDNTCKISLKNDIIHLVSGMRKSFSVATGPYPYFPTDMQAQCTSLLSVSSGISVVEENVFEMRFRHIPELIKMGADIKVRGSTAIIRGVKKLHAAEVTAYDLRCGAALVLAGLVAEGKTVVCGIKHLERGYLEMDKKLRCLGADIIKD